MKKKTFRKTAMLLALILTSALMIGLIPSAVSAENGKATHTVLLEGMPKYSEVKIAQIKGSSKEMLLFSVNYNEEAAELYYSIGNDRLFSRPNAIDDDGVENWEIEPFLYSDDNMIMSWTNAEKSFNENATGNEIAAAMRISVTSMNSETFAFNDTISNANIYTSENSGTYNSRVTKINGKILVSWVVCDDIAFNDNAYGIEGLYYDPENNKFYSENNRTDANGNPVPMIFASSCNYILSYAICEKNNKPVAIFEEASAQTHIDDVMYDKIVTQNFLFRDEKYKNSTIKIAQNNGNDVTALTDGNSNASVVNSQNSDLIYYNQNKIHRIDFDLNGTMTDTILGDVSKTGDTTYTALFKNGELSYITAIGYEPYKTSSSEITIFDKKYTKNDDGKWYDEQNIERIIEQENGCFYYYNPSTNQLDALSQRMLNEDNKIFYKLPSFNLNASDQVTAIYNYGSPEKNKFTLCYSQYDREYLFKGDYSKVDEAIKKANPLNQDDYKDFSAVTDAINAVVRNLDYTKQDEIDGYARAIEDAIAALKLKDADYTKVDEAINKANALNKDLYKNFADVTNAINAVVRNMDFTKQSEVDNMALAIENAINGLIYKDADYSKVDDAIERANSLDKKKYMSFAAVEEAIGNVVRGKNITEQDVVDKMATAIEQAINDLKFISADYAKVDDAIGKVMELNKYVYNILYDNYPDVAAAIGSVDREKKLDQQEAVDDMAIAIEDALKNLKLKNADYSNVDKALDKAKALDKSLYKDFSAVDKAVNDVIRNKDITEQSAVDSMAWTIENAISALRLKDADYSKVDEAINKAIMLDNSKYSDISSVIAAVNAVVRNKDITEQAAVDNMAVAIENAIGSLRLKPTEATTESTTEHTTASQIASTDNDTQNDAQTTTLGNQSTSAELSADDTAATQITANDVDSSSESIDDSPQTGAEGAPTTQTVVLIILAIGISILLIYRKKSMA